MNIFNTFKKLIKSIDYSYIPPNSLSKNQITLNEAILECSKKGKLLVLYLTKNNIKIKPNLEFPNEDFLVFISPINSKSVYEIIKSFPIKNLPFVGLFYCPTNNYNDVQLIDQIIDNDDIIRAGQHFNKLKNKLY